MLASASSECGEFVELVEDLFYTQHVLCPTRGDAVLDLVLTSEPDLVSDVHVIDSLGSSDHNMVVFTTHLSCTPYISSKQVWSYKLGNYEEINDALAEVDWDDLMSGTTHDCWDKFKKLLFELHNRYIPIKRINTKLSGVKPIWMTRKALKSVKRKRKVYMKFKDTSHPAVKAANKVAKSEVRKSKRNFEVKLAKNIKSDTKSFFAYVRNKTKSKVETGPLLNDSGVTLDSQTDMAEEFNRYFASVFTSENASHLPTAVDMFLGPADEKCSDVLFTLEDVMKALSKHRVDKASGADDLSSRFLLQVKDHIAYPLLLLFQKSLDEGVVPHDWKLANICPIYKKGPRNKAENYRPVSLTSQVCKLFESIMRDVLVDHLEKNMLINNSQHGFRKGRSCLTNLLTFLDKVTGSLDSDGNVDIVFLDFAKAFDKVPHKQLALKLVCHGIGHRWESFSRGRRLASGQSPESLYKWD